jgi:hypothetical protein
MTKQATTVGNMQSPTTTALHLYETTSTIDDNLNSIGRPSEHDLESCLELQPKFQPPLGCYDSLMPLKIDTANILLS